MIPGDIAARITRVGIIPYVDLRQRSHPLTLTDSEVLRSIRKKQIRDTRHSVVAIALAAAVESRFWFAMAIDAKFGELTDCGGQRKPSETIERTASRELFEESMGLFDARYDLEKIRASPVITNGLTCIFFLHIESASHYGFPDHLVTAFQDRKVRAQQESVLPEETSLMYWISSSDLNRLLLEKCTKTSQHQPYSISSIPVSSFQSASQTGHPIQNYTNAALQQLSVMSSPPLDSEKEMLPHHPCIYSMVHRLLKPVFEPLLQHLEAR